MPTYPTFTEAIGSRSALGVAKEPVFRQQTTATAFTPFETCTLGEDPAVYSPATMQGVITTDVYQLQGEVKLNGQIKSPLFSTNGVPMLLGSVGVEGQVGSGVRVGVAQLVPGGTPGNSTCSASITVGATSITVASGVGFATNQVAVLEPGTTNEERVRVVSVAGNVLTVSATVLAHNGTVTPFVVQTCGAMSAGAVAAGASTFSVAAGLGTLFGATAVVSIDVNGASTTSETHACTVATDTFTITDLTPNNVLAFAHGAAVQVIFGGTPTNPGLFDHIVPGSDLPSFTIEKNVGNVQSLIFPGSKFAKCALAAPGGNNPASMQVDVMGATVPVVQATPTVASTQNENPFTFAEGSVNIYGANHPECSNMKINWDNVLKETYGYNGSHVPNFLTKTNFHVTGGFDALFSKFDDATNGWWKHMDSGDSAPLTFAMTHPDGSMVQVYMPIVRLTKVPIDPTAGNVINQAITFHAFYGLSSGTGNMVVTVRNRRWLPY